MSVQTIDYTPTVLDTTLSLEQQCEAIWQETLKQERAEQRLRRKRPDLFVYDGEWDLHYLITDEDEAEFSWIDNDTGPGSTVLPWDSYVAGWIWDMQGRIDRGEKRNVHLVVEHCGARWAGRLDNARANTTGTDKTLIVTWLHDYENLKWYSVWSNPFTPATFQWPRVFILAGPIPWLALTTLHLQILREHNPLLTIPDDPLDFGSYIEELDPSNWHMVVKPTTFLESMASGALWGIASSRWSNWHDMFKQMLWDSELSVVPTRYLDGDEPPWPGASLRHGTLWIDIVDKSGSYIGTSHGGTLFDGLGKTVLEFGEDFIDSTADVILDTDVPNEYLLPGNRLTMRQMPYVVYRENDQSGIQESNIIISPAKGVRVGVGGHSMPGINESIGATIIAGFGMLGSIVGLGALGTSIDTLIKPIYEDTVAAWWSVTSPEREQNSGWDRYFEYFQDGSSKAFTVASLMVLRAGFFATKTTVSCQISVIDGAPWMVGDRGLGHFWLADRIGVALADDPRKLGDVRTIGRVHVEQVKRVDLKWSTDSPFAEWVITIGDDKAMEDPAQRAWGKIEAIVSALRELGVY